MEVELTRNEVFFKKSMGVLCIMFLIGAILFAVAPDHVERVLNWSGHLLGMKAPLIAGRTTIDQSTWSHLVDPKHPEEFSQSMGFLPGSRIWSGLAVTMMLMIAYIAGMNFLDPRKYMGWVPLLLISKGSTSVLGLLFFFFQAKYLSNLIMTITDFPIFLFVLIIWLRARSSQNQVVQAK